MNEGYPWHAYDIDPIKQSAEWKRKYGKMIWGIFEEPSESETLEISRRLEE